MRNERAWPQKCWNSYENGSNIVVLRFGYHGTKELLAEKFDWFQTLRNKTPQHPTTCNRMCERTQDVTSNNVGRCWPTMLRPFARSLMGCILPTVHCRSNIIGRCCISLHATANTHATISNITGATMLGVVASVCT